MNLFGLSREALEEVAISAGLPAFRGRQIYRAIYARGVRTFDEMTDLARGLRERLAGEHAICRPEIASRHVSRDGTIKFQFALSDGRHVETVYIPDGERHTFPFHVRRDANESDLSRLSPEQTEKLEAMAGAHFTADPLEMAPTDTPPNPLAIR